MFRKMSRRSAMRMLASLAGLSATGSFASAIQAAKRDPKWETAIEQGLKWVASEQSSLGHWTAGSYPTAMTALAGTALICSGSTTTQGPYAKNIRRAVDYLITKCRSNGLI